MKKMFFSLFISIVMMLPFAGNLSAEECTVMHPDFETLLQWKFDYETAPKAPIDEELKYQIPLKGSYSLLSHLQYTPSQRSQGSCGNCWVWAGTGIMEVALSVQNSIKDRMSIQYLNSCKTGSYACCGGNLTDFTNFYTSTGNSIPWSNTNAGFQDGSSSCSSGSSSVSCGSISTSPLYSIASISPQTITTHGVSQASAIANIKNILHQNKAVWFAFYLADDDDWNNFRSFWNTQGETAIWNPDYSCGHTWVTNEGAGHAVLCVGYNDDDSDHPY